MREMKQIYPVDGTSAREPELIEVELQENTKIKQRAYGFLLILIGILMPLVCNGDVSASLLLIPAGIALMATKKDLFQ